MPGGVAILAHPFTLFSKNSVIDAKTLDPVLKNLSDVGLDGMEVFYSSYSANQIRFYREAADRFELLPSGGSDFHGSHKPGIDLGVGRGQLKVPFKVIEALRNKAQSYRLEHADSKLPPHL